MSRRDGGPAFPVPLPPKAPFQEYGAKGKAGMSLRDYFAGQALASMGVAWHPSDTELLKWAKNAYRIADAMLAARGGDGVE